jgi:hypothetical protein
VFTGKIGQATSKQTLGDANFPADDARLVLAEVHTPPPTFNPGTPL